MSESQDWDEYDQEIYLAGQRVPPGCYRQVDRLRVLHLEQEDVLPASLDGHVACYHRLELSEILEPGMPSGRFVSSGTPPAKVTRRFCRR